MKLSAFVLLILATLAIAIGRFIVPVQGLNGQDVFKDVAHLTVGVLFGVGGKILADDYVATERLKPNLPGVLALALTAVELVAFITRG